jgi:hypothetical protein
MQKHLIVIAALVFFCTIIPQETAPIATKNLTTIETEEEIIDLQELIMSTSFIQLVQSFVSVFKKIIVACSEITADASLNNANISSQDIMKAIEQDPSIKQEIACLLKRHSHLFITRNNMRPCQQIDKADQEDVQRILNSFAGVMQCFFRIVQDPENKEQVTNELLGMLANVLQASKVIMKGSDILLDEDKEVVEQQLTSIEESVLVS